MLSLSILSSWGSSTDAMAGHQRMGMHCPYMLESIFAQPIQVRSAIVVCEKYRLTIIAPLDCMYGHIRSLSVVGDLHPDIHTQEAGRGDFPETPAVLAYTYLGQGSSRLSGQLFKGGTY